jgi:hypothetical protein
MQPQNTKNPGLYKNYSKEGTNLIRFTLLFASILYLSACGGLSNKGGYTFSENSKRLNLEVGDIKEITVKSSRDSTWQIIGASDNKEIVDVTSKQDPSEETTTNKIPDNGSLTFLVKGVTNGRIRIIFSEKRIGETGSGRILKTYLVDVVSN